MGTSTTLTFRIDSGTKARLEALAKTTKRSKSSLVAEGVEAFVEREERQTAGIELAIASLNRDEGVPQAEVAAWIASWESEDELLAPTA